MWVCLLVYFTKTGRGLSTQKQPTDAIFVAQLAWPLPRLRSRHLWALPTGREFRNKNLRVESPNIHGTSNFALLKFFYNIEQKHGRFINSWLFTKNPGIKVVNALSANGLDESYALHNLTNNLIDELN